MIGEDEAANSSPTPPMAVPASPFHAFRDMNTSEMYFHFYNCWNSGCYANAKNLLALSASPNQNQLRVNKRSVMGHMNANINMNMAMNLNVKMMNMNMNMGYPPSQLDYSQPTHPYHSPTAQHYSQPTSLPQNHMLHPRVLNMQAQNAQMNLNAQPNPYHTQNHLLELQRIAAANGYVLSPVHNSETLPHAGSHIATPPHAHTKYYASQFASPSFSPSASPQGHAHMPHMQVQNGMRVPSPHHVDSRQQQQQLQQQQVYYTHVPPQKQN